MRVLVTGASGVIGAYLIPRLIDRGHAVVGTTRSPDKLERVRRLGAEPVLLDGLDGAQVGNAVARAAPEAIIHEMTALGGKPDFRNFDRWFSTTNALRTDGTRHLLAAARATGSVRRFVVGSYTGWTNATTGGPIKTEADPLEPNPAPNQRQSQAAMIEMEQLVRDAPLEGIVLRYANIYGPGASDNVLALLRKRMLPIIGDGGGIWPWIHIDDLAAATVEALERANPGATFNIADDEPARVADWLPYLAEVVGAPKPLRVPVWLGRLLAGEVGVRMMTRARGSSNARVKTELGWRPARSSWRQGFRELASQPRDMPAHVAR